MAKHDKNPKIETPHEPETKIQKISNENSKTQTDDPDTIIQKKDDDSNESLDGENPSLNLASITQTSIQIGEAFGHYKIIEKVAKGGMGTVYKAYDNKLNRTVALKVLTEQDDSLLQRFMQEARAMAAVHHLHIAEIYEVGATPRGYIVMEYIDGDILHNLVYKNVLSISDIARVINKIAKALTEVHKHGIIHRDVKPGNIMLDRRKFPKIMDFGIAKMKNRKISATGEVLGTPNYMSPEQAQGKEVDAQSDLYSLGATLYEALTHRPPFQGESFVNMVYQIVENDPIAPRILNPDIPLDLEAICLKCLAKKKSLRYSSCKMLAKDLENFLDDRPIMAKPSTRVTQVKKFVLRNKSATVTSLLSALVVFVCTVLLILGLKRQAKMQKQIAQKAHKAQLQMMVERDKAISANKELNKAQQRIIAERDKAKEAVLRAQEAQQKVRATLYYLNITLAQKFCEEGDGFKAEKTLNSPENCPKPMRDWEWRWLNNKTHDEFKILKAHKRGILSCDVSKDSKTLITGDLSGHLLLWDLATYKLKKSFKHRGPVRGCSVNSNGSLVAAISTHNPMLVWGVKKGRPVRSLPQYTRGTNCVFSPNDKELISTYEIIDQPIKKQKQHGLVVWNLATKRKLKSIRAHSGNYYNNVNFCDISHDGKWIVTCGQDKKVMLWNKATGKLQKTFEEHQDEVHCCRFSPDGKKIVSGSSNGNVVLWDINSAKALFVLNKHRGAVYNCDFTPDGKFLISVGQDSKVIVWEVATGKLWRIFMGHRGAVYSCRSIDNQTFVSVGEDRQVRIWKLFGNIKPLSLKKQGNFIRFCAFHPDNTLATVREYSPMIDFWDSATGGPKKKLYIRSPSRGCIFSKDGTRILAVGANALRLFALKNDKPLVRFTGSKNTFTCCAYSKDETKVIAGGYAKTLYLWDATLPKKVEKEIFRKPLWRLFHSQLIMDCAFSPDGKSVLSICYDGTIRIWDISNMKKIPKPILIKTKKNLYSCDFHPDGTTFITSEKGRIILWDAKTRQKQAIFQGHIGEIYECIFNKNGNRIISVGNDGTLKIWQSVKKQKQTSIITVPLLSINAHRTAIYGLAMNNSGTKIATGDKSGLVKVWDAGN